MGFTKVVLKKLTDDNVSSILSNNVVKFKTNNESFVSLNLNSYMSVLYYMNKINFKKKDDAFFHDAIEKYDYIKYYENEKLKLSFVINILKPLTTFNIIYEVIQYLISPIYDEYNLFYVLEYKNWNCKLCMNNTSSISHKSKKIKQNTFKKRTKKKPLKKRFDKYHGKHNSKQRRKYHHKQFNGYNMRRR